ncbi:trace amine-associated receptor 1 [Scyliorhinus canicula]|uniref:trace amine-associated receptor 1 n=1 Tax=Scyliorhinus canicula TaxID=7830 RepID=UPI0018F58274|nr:trace amine-associated receptor 1 [Scyliorhinus canicula]
MENISSSFNVTSPSGWRTAGQCLSSTGRSAVKPGLYIFITMIMMATMVGNCLVVLAIFYFKKLRSITNAFVLSLAVADFLVGIMVMPYSMIRTIEGCWHFGPIFCQIHSSLDVMFCTASILHLSCIALDRYYAVCDPLAYHCKMSPGKVVILLFVCWTVPAAISFIPIMLQLHKFNIAPDLLTKSSCVFMVNPIYAVCASLIAFYLPMFTMLAAYWKIYRAARKQAIQIGAVDNQIQGCASGFVTAHTHKQSIKRERKAAKTLGIIIGAFLVFWLPFFTANIVDPFLGYKLGRVTWEVLIWLGYSNSSLNPFLYAFFNRSFRRAFLNIISCKICAPRSLQNMDLSNSKAGVVQESVP